VGEFIRALPIAVAISLGTSFFVAMLLTPLMARFFIRQGLVDHAADSSEPRKLTPLDHMQKGYNRVITWAMLNKRLVLVSSVLAFVAGLVNSAPGAATLLSLAERDQFVDGRVAAGRREDRGHGCSRAPH